MIKLSKSIIIEAPPEDVFDVIDDTANLPEIWKNLSNIRNLKNLPTGGHSFKFDYTMAGIKIEGTSVDLQYIRPNLVVTRTTGGIISILTWLFKPIQNGKATDLQVDIEYEVPIPLIGKLAEILIIKINENDINYVLNYLKIKLTGGGLKK
jgi:uncharacterized membrane protein